MEIIEALKVKAKESILKDPKIAILTPYKAQKKLLVKSVNEKRLNIIVHTINESQGTIYITGH